MEKVQLLWPHKTMKGYFEGTTNSLELVNFNMYQFYHFFDIAIKLIRRSQFIFIYLHFSISVICFSSNISSTKIRHLWPISFK
jgi:hypothetical protein